MTVSSCVAYSVAQSVQLKFPKLMPRIHTPISNFRIQNANKKGNREVVEEGEEEGKHCIRRNKQSTAYVETNMTRNIYSCVGFFIHVSITNSAQQHAVCA